eukprot:362478-Chlamydomonas_euryale.AAC.11
MQSHHKERLSSWMVLQSIPDNLDIIQSVSPKQHMEARQKRWISRFKYKKETQQKKKQPPQLRSRTKKQR